ncbi:Oidioi.mRNA.OKI2018_I69.PAR.g9361.t1.cds [Oikopleura dioica]|uniref:Oidioi.mRNA.OKI2018_I69.PAR.g9361.t1.cds n=1 Tax=Oikopleura dioica TaxID=34765 RepID=A0ABN7RL60_OIKDI|nr:Oidioi.mRNA.OKI2018_I69.PAR.g9361.t1.cds [Oikopleura dioica]
MPKALPDDLKNLVAEKYEKTNPPLKPSELSKWATAHFGRPVSGQVCTAIIKTTKRDQKANPKRTAFEDFLGFQAKVAYNERRSNVSRTEVLLLAKNCRMLPFFNPKDVPNLTPNWYSMIRDRYGLPKGTNNQGNIIIFDTANRAKIMARHRKQEEFKLRPKVLIPYSWEFIDEKWLCNWNSNRDPKDDNILEEIVAPPLHVYALPGEVKAPNYDAVQ